jgi:hypothetical protein
MWKKGFRGWFYLSIAAALVVSARSADIYWLILELGMVAAVLGATRFSTTGGAGAAAAPDRVHGVPFTVYWR